MDNEVTIDGKIYSIGKIDAWTSFHVFRRLIPILSSLANAMQGSVLTRADSSVAAQAAFAVGLNAVAQSLAGMSDADIDYVLKSCLKVCKRKNPDSGNWFPMMSMSGTLMYSEDMSASSLLQVTAAILQRQEGLLDFFTKAGTSSTPSDQAAGVSRPS